MNGRKTIKLKITDFFGERPERIWEYRILSELYDVRLVDRAPEYVLDGGLGTEHLAYPEAVKIVRIGESYCPDFNQFDYAIGFDHLEFGDRYLRLPLFAYYSQFRRLHERRSVPFDARSALDRGFCSFVVSNPDGDPVRTEFFHRLSEYKPVASGGGLFNNVGGRVPDKSAFIAQYKFNIAFENSCVPGYTTEKVMEPLAARTLPIYYGNPRIGEDFDPACMVHLSSRADIERAVEEIIRLDTHDDEYLARLAAPAAMHDVSYYEERLVAFLRRIFDQPLREAKRLNDYGYQVNIRRRQLRAQTVLDWTSPRWLARKLRGKK